MATKRTAQKLLEAKSHRRFIRFTRRFEEGFIRGYVVDVGPVFFLLALVSDRVRFDGFECFRISDVSHLQNDPYSAFAEGALKKRGDRRPQKPRISMETLEDILVGANRTFPLVTIHREGLEPDVCHIGRVVRIHDDHISLLEIGPDAEWDDADSEYRIREITRMNFGGDYENALYLVGGEPPSAPRDKARHRVRS